MELKIPSVVIDLAKKGKRVKSKLILEASAWGEYEVFEHSHLAEGDVKALIELCKEAPAGTKYLTPLIRKLKTLADPNLLVGKKHVKLDELAEAIRETVRGLPNRWVFAEDKLTGEASPYLVIGVTFVEATRRSYDYVPAHVVIKYRGFRRGDHKDERESIYRPDLLDGMTAVQALAAKGVMVETPGLVEAYRESVEKYEGLKSKMGLQLVAVGKGQKLSDDDDEESWYWRRQPAVQFDAQGMVGRAVLDDAEGWKDDQVTQAVPQQFRGDDEDETEEDKIDVVRLPEHPYVRVFDLRNHVYALTHVNNVDRYVYNRLAFDKVVLPADVKGVIDLLVNSDKAGDDVIGGKGKGVVILSSGPPGTGKTLTAEAYSERARKPLYSVQCSQLGMDPEAIEKELAGFLDKCTRWGAIGLIDEADVFIRERGDDLAQNAIVGVFLRVLEYYRGVLFLTTNREDVVDDAILSRCIVHVRYRVPDAEESRKIWAIMLDQFGVRAHPSYTERMKDALPGFLAERFPGVSGRTIKQLCRLVRTHQERTGKDAEVEDFEWAAQFQDITVNPNRKGKK